MLDVNAGIPLVDEAELLKHDAANRPGHRGRADLHRLLGDRGARGRPVGVRGPRARELGDRRGRAARADAAAGRAPRRGRDRARQRRDRDPARRPRSGSSARARSSASPPTTASRATDVVIDPLAMPVGADTEAVQDDARDDPADPRRARREHVPRRVERLVRAARAPRAERAFLPMAMAAGLTSAIMSTAEVCVDSGHGRPTCCSATTSGARAGSPPTARAAAARSRAGGRRCRERAARRSAAGASALRAVEVEPAPADGAERVRLRFLPDGAEVRVPSGTPVFDAASWNGIAIDSTCGGYGTCKKCKVRVVSGERAGGADRSARVHAGRAAGRLAAGLPGDGPRRPGRRGAAAADAAEGGAGRRRASRDPATVGPEAPPGARGADARGSAVGPPAGAGRDR